MKSLPILKKWVKSVKSKLLELEESTKIRAQQVLVRLVEVVLLFQLI